jgi:putative toxin-antitoxin system antitoxin component (TIGR02293 family)
MVVSISTQPVYTPQELFTQLLGLHPGNRLQVIEAVAQGLEVSAFERVAAALGVTEKRLAELLRIKPSTLARRKRIGRLSSEESERLYRMAFLVERAVQVLGSLDGAQRWLTTDKRALGCAVTGSTDASTIASASRRTSGSIPPAIRGSEAITRRPCPRAEALSRRG